MKKILLATALVIVMGLGATAQSDGFFSNWDHIGNGLDRDPDLGLDIPTLPGSHGNTTDVVAPLGSGLLVLTALGAGYAVARRKREE